MKNLIFFSLIFVHISNAQEVRPLDTIYANEFYNTSLFFPDPVKQGVVGAEHFSFSFNEIEAQRFGLLKAVPGENTNLLVFTTDGSIYSYILSYRRDLPKLNYFIGKGEEIGSEVPRQDSLISPKKILVEEELRENDSINRRETYLRKAAAYYLDLKPKKLQTKNKDGITLKVEDLRYFQDEVFVVLELANKSGINFEVDYLRLFLVKGNKKRSGSFQKLQQEQLWSYQQPEVVRHGEARRFVLVFPKFIPGDHEKIGLELREQQGNRMLEIKFKPKKP